MNIALLHAICPLENVHVSDLFGSGQLHNSMGVEIVTVLPILTSKHGFYNNLRLPTATKPEQ